MNASQTPSTLSAEVGFNGACPPSNAVFRSGQGLDNIIIRAPFSASYTMDDVFNAGNPLRAPFAASYTMDDTLDATLDSVSAEHPVRTFFDQSMPAQACFATSDIMSSTQAPPIQSCFNAMPEDFTNSVV